MRFTEFRVCICRETAFTNLDVPDLGEDCLWREIGYVVVVHGQMLAVQVVGEAEEM